MSFEQIPIIPEIDISCFYHVRYMEFKKNFSYREESHDPWEMIYVEQGAINVKTSSGVHTLQKGQALFHYPHELHAHSAVDGTSGTMIVVSFACNSPAMDFFRGRILTLEKSSRKILSLFLAESNHVMGEISVPHHPRPDNIPTGSLQLMQCYWVEFLYSIIRSSNPENTNDLPIPDARESDRVYCMDAILSYIQANISAQPSLSTLCDLFSISRPYLYHIFNENVGKSPIDYWISLKMTEAKRLIRDGKLNITQIADQLGYASIHHFSRMFKRHVGVSPRTYQKSVGK